MQEVLVLIVVALLILYLPRILKNRARAPEPVRRPIPLTGRMRLAILLTAFWLAGSAAIHKPWQGEVLPFLSLGLGPVAATWGVAWVWFGYKKYQR